MTKKKVQHKSRVRTRIIKRNASLESLVIDSIYDYLEYYEDLEHDEKIYKKGRGFRFKKTTEMIIKTIEDFFGFKIKHFKKKDDYIMFNLVFHVYDPMWGENEEMYIKCEIDSGYDLYLSRNDISKIIKDIFLCVKRSFYKTLMEDGRKALKIHRRQL